MDAATLKAGGWQRLPTVRYSAAIGKMWIRRDPSGPIVGLMAEEHLANDNLERFSTDLNRIGIPLWRDF